MRLPLALLLVLSLAACSGDDDRDDAAPAVASPSASVTAAPSGPPSSTASPPTGDPSSSPSAAAPVGPSPSRPAPSAAPPPAPTGPVALIGGGVDLPSQVVVFGTPYEQARDAFDDALGTPTLDTGVIDPFSGYGTCPGEDLQVLEYGGGALQLYFGTLEGGGRTFYSWALADRGSPAAVPQAQALIGDQATFEFAVGTPVAALEEGLGQILTVSDGDEIFGPGFEVADQSGGFFGSFDSTAPDGEVTFVVAGRSCGE